MPAADQPAAQPVDAPAVSEPPSIGKEPRAPVESTDSSTPNRSPEVSEAMGSLPPNSPSAAPEKDAKDEPAAGESDDEDPLPERLRGVEFTAENVKKIWDAALSEISDMASDFAAQASEVAISAPNVLAVRFLARYNTSKSYCERPERREKLEKVVSEIVGKKIHLDFSILRDDAAHEPVPQPTVKNNQQLKREITSHPMVEAAAEIFDAQVSKIDPGNRSG